MVDASQNSDPIEVGCASGREETFTTIQGNLDLCQKSLSDYLEVKKNPNLNPDPNPNPNLNPNPNPNPTPNPDPHLDPDP